MFTRIKKSLGINVEHKYLFILCPPHCGSTLLSQIICTSEKVSINNPDGTMEGQTLPRVRDIMFVDRRWEEDCPIDWPFVKQLWHEHWNTRKPILLEKSPANIVRAEQIQAAFQPAYFIIAWRNPYAHCESLMRRIGNTPRQAAGFAIRCLQLQKRNSESLQNVLAVSYEDLTDAPDIFADDAGRFLPELRSLKTDGQFDVHNYLNQSLTITNLNADKIAKLSKQEIADINSVFGKHIELLRYFGYPLLAPEYCKLS